MQGRTKWILVEVAVMVGLVVVVEWLQHDLTNTRNTVVPAAAMYVAYCVIRSAVSARRRDQGDGR